MNMYYIREEGSKLDTPKKRTGEDKNKLQDKRKLVMIEREYLSLDGVNDVETFDGSKVLLKTSLGVLLIKGSDLHIKALDIDETKLELEGHIKLFEYIKDRTSKGFFRRLFK